MRSLEIDAGCFGCSYLKFNGIVKMPSEDGYDCMKCNIRVIDFFMIKNLVMTKKMLAMSTGGR